MNLIFLTYINRSGSTYLANLFSKSKNILVCPEAEVIMNEFLILPEKKFEYNQKISKRLHGFFNYDRKLKYWGLTLSALSELNIAKTNFEAFFYILDAYRKKVKPEAHTIIFKAESLIYLYENIPLRFKEEYNLKLIAIIRDCRGVYASQKRTYFPGSNFIMSRNPVRTALFWNEFVTKAHQLEVRDKFLLIRYEDLIDNLKKTIEVIIKYLKIKPFDYISGEGELWARLPEDQRSIHQNIVKNCIRQKISHWQKELNKYEIFNIEKFAGSGLKRMEYKAISDSDMTNKNLFRITYYLFLYYLRKVYKRIIHSL
ncbi:MAG: sulfotransferase [Bacteroidales bacterium]|nr:sulfotransferase [Bacteroidales bacterium]